MNEEIVANARLIVMKIINVNLNHGEKKNNIKKRAFSFEISASRNNTFKQQQ